MSLVVCLVAGAVLGFIASIVKGHDARHGILLNVAVGVVGSLLGTWILSPLIGGVAVKQGDFTAVDLVSSLVGATLLLGLAGFLRRARIQ